MELKTKFWLKFSLVNLLLVAVLGTLMRYKIGYEFPYFNQLYLQHAHSHFAFSGWITHTLYVLIINFIQRKGPLVYYKQLTGCLIGNLFCAYGMLVSFPIQGYGGVSIMFSIGTIIVSCFFAYYYYKELKKTTLHIPENNWFRAALWLNIFSSLGKFYLGYMMTSGNINSNWYLASVYFYLHFQYNGFFIFTCLGLAHAEIRKLLPFHKYDATMFKLFFPAVIPAYFLSILWVELPLWLYLIVVIAAFLQALAWTRFLLKIRKSVFPKTILTNVVRYLFLFVITAFSIKLLLQLGSTVPTISHLAFGFRPIVIAYLHLVLLAVISVFLLAYMHLLKLITVNRLSVISLIAFSVGVLLNELVLAVQGVASFSYVPVPKVNETLFFVSLFIVLGLILLLLSQIRGAGDQNAGSLSDKVVATGVESI